MGVHDCSLLLVVFWSDRQNTHLTTRYGTRASSATPGEGIVGAEHQPQQTPFDRKHVPPGICFFRNDVGSPNVLASTPAVRMWGAIQRPYAPAPMTVRLQFPVFIEVLRGGLV